MVSQAAHYDDGLEEADTRQAGSLLQFLLCMVSALEGADMVLLPAVFYALQTDLHLSLNNLATLSLVQALFQAVAAPLWGVLADRGTFKRKTILITGSVLQGALTILLAGVDTFGPMIALRALCGVMLASLRPVGNGVLADVTSEARRGKVYGWIFFALNAGMVVGSLVGTNLSTKSVYGIQGWRVAFVIMGGLAVLVGILLCICMTEPEREGAKLASQYKGVLSELRRLWSYCKMPTFLALVIQGCFGCIPWNAISYRTLFFQVGGLSDFQASFLQAFGQGTAAVGSLLGGILADCVTNRCLRLHGRPLVAQISVLLGIPFAALTFLVIPSPSWAFWYYLLMGCALGSTASWCATGVNLPILSEIVQADNRSAIMAWQTALEGSFAAVLGNAMVGILAQNFFGYDVSKAREDASIMQNSASRDALGKALTLTIVVPWLICLTVYTLLHFTYPMDLRRVQAAAAQQTGLHAIEPTKIGTEQDDQFDREDPTDPSQSRDEKCTPSDVGYRPRISLNAAIAAAA